MILINLNPAGSKTWTDLQAEISLRQGFHVVDIPFEQKHKDLNANILAWYNEVLNSNITNQPFAVLVDGDIVKETELLGFLNRLKIPIFMAQYGDTGNFMDYQLIKPNPEEQIFIEKLPWYRRSWLILRYLLSENVGQLLLVLLAVLYTINRWYNFKTDEPMPELAQAATPVFSPSAFLYWDFFEPIVGFATLGIAIFVWYNEQKENWLSKLPKRLDAKFVFDNQIIGEVLGATLAHEGDVRQYAQQMGKTELNNNVILEMELKFDITFVKQPHINQFGEIYLPFVATLYLKKSNKTITNTVGQKINEFVPSALHQSYPVGLGIRHYVRTNTSKLFPLS
ncbi:MAG: hypothetical protein MUF58_13505 [Arcicella sp.]|jgi:hypothetical protein|nr:hypothetical protein [Arcicella sp.]